jgi:hypothetical protein
MQTWIVPVVRVRQRTSEVEVQADSQEQARAIAEMLDDEVLEKLNWGGDGNDEEDNIDYHIDEPFKK